MTTVISKWLAAVFCLALAASALAAENTGQPMIGHGMMSGQGQQGMAQWRKSRGHGHDMMRGHDRTMMPGMMRGYDRMFGANSRMMGAVLHKLDLTDAQRGKIMHLMYAQHEAMWKDMDATIDARMKLREQYAQDEPDPGKVGAAFAEIAKVNQKMIESGVRTHNAIWKVLTKEQQTQMQQMRHSKWHHAGPSKYQSQGAMTPAPK